MINLVADRNCPTWTKLRWWQRLLRRKPERLVYRLPDGTLVCSFETKAHIEAAKPMIIKYQEGL